MTANRSYSVWKFFLSKRSIRGLAALASLLIFTTANSAFAQVTHSHESKSEAEPIDPVREKQKEVYFKLLKEGTITPVQNLEAPVESTEPNESTDPIDPAREKQKEDYFKALKEGQSNLVEKHEVNEDVSAEELPSWNDTGNFEADKAEYLLALEGWLERNSSFYTEEELEFLKNPIMTVEQRQQSIQNN